MEKLESALKALFGEKTLALSAETETAWAEKVNALAVELPALPVSACACAQAENYKIFTHFSLIFGYGRLYWVSKPEAVQWIMISMKLFCIS